MQNLTSMRLNLCLILSMVSAPVWAQNAKPSISDTLYKTIAASGVKTAIAQYHKLKAGAAQRYDFSEGQLNLLGYKLMGEERYQEALEIFELNVDQFPQSVNVYDSLGECYLASGNRDAAIENYSRVLEMLPNSSIPPNRQPFFEANARSKLFEAKHFDPRSDQALNYISFFGGAPAGKWDMENLAAFKEKHRGIKISYQGNNLYSRPVPHTVPSRFEPKFKADVMTGFVGGIYRTFIESGQIADISDLWKEKGWDDVFPASFKRLATYDGRQYFVPQAFQFNPVFYRKDIFDKHGWKPPGSWTELLLLCDTIHKAGYSPFTVSAEGWPPPVARWFTILNLRLNGPGFHDQVMRGEIAYTDKRIRDVFAHWAELFEHHAFHDSTGWNNYPKGVRDLASGKAVMYNLGEWLYESLSDEQKPLLDFFVMPELNPDVESAEIVHTYGAFMIADSRQPEAARALLSSLASQESQSVNAKTLQRINANTKVDRSLYTDVQLRLFEHVKNTEVLVPLLEFSTEANLAEAALAAFVKFWRNPDEIETVLNEWENKRKELVGGSY